MPTSYKIKTRLFIGGLLAALVLYLPLLQEPQMRHEESRRALIAETMLAEGSYLVPVFKEQVYAAKPPGYNWLIIAVSAPFGEISEFTIRLASLLCLLTLLAVMLTLLGRHLDGPALTFLAAGIILAPEMMKKGTLGEIDMLFTLLVSSALWLWFQLDRHRQQHHLPPHLTQDESLSSQAASTQPMDSSDKHSDASAESKWLAGQAMNQQATASTSSTHEQNSPHLLGKGDGSSGLQNEQLPQGQMLRLFSPLGNPWLLPGILIALAFLTKREPALVFYYGGLGALLLYQRRFKAFFQPEHLLAAGLTLGIVCLWLWFMLASAGPDTLLASSMQEVVGRGLGGNLQTWLLHLLTWPLDILLALFPFSLMLLLFLHSETRRAAFQQDGPLLTFTLITASVGFGIHWLTPQSAVRYYLPLMPTLLVVCALLYHHARVTAPHWLKYMALGLNLLLVLLSGVLLAYLQLEYLGLSDSPLPPPVMPATLATSLAVTALVASLLLLCWQFEKSTARQDGADQRHQHLHLLTLVSFCAVMVLFRIIHYAALLPDRLENFREHRPVKQFVADIYARVPQADMPIGSPAAMPHEIWWYMEYGDVTTRPRPYQLVFEDEFAEGWVAPGDDTAAEPGTIARMTWRGQGIALVKSVEQQ